MDGNFETSVSQVGLRDFLFYVLPGGILLIALFAWKGTTGKDLEDYLGLGPSLAGILVAYALGQCAYVISYLIRWLLDRFQAIDKTIPTFRRAYRCAPRDNGTFFAVEIFRYRTMARFCSVMVFPVCVAALGILLGHWPVTYHEKIAATCFGVIGLFGFIYRYHRYEGRYRKAVLECQSSDPGPSAGE